MTLPYCSERKNLASLKRLRSMIYCRVRLKKLVRSPGSAFDPDVMVLDFSQAKRTATATNTDIKSCRIVEK